MQEPSPAQPERIQPHSGGTRIVGVRSAALPASQRTAPGGCTLPQRSIHTLLSRQSRIWGEVEALSQLGGQCRQPLIKVYPELRHAITANATSQGNGAGGVTDAGIVSATCPHAEKVSCLPPWEGWVASQAGAGAGAGAAAAGRGSPAGRVLTGAACHTRALRGLCYSPAVGHLVSRQSSEFSTAMCV